jgi:hypothetical protein
VEVILMAAAQIDALIQDLLDMTRLEAGRLTVAPREVAPAPLVEAALFAMRTLAESSGVELLATYEEELPTVHADPERVTQLLSNLVGNALKFTPAGGRVEVRVQPYGEGALVSVSDNGEGIPQPMLGRIFNMFTQVNTGSRAQGGLGIGLTLARTLVHLHGGTIEAFSEGPDRGCEFVVQLPLAEQQAIAPTQPGETLPLDRPLSRQRVLVVAHQVIVNCMRYLVDNLDEEQILGIDRLGDVPNCGVTSWRVSEDGCRLLPDLTDLVAPLVRAGTPVTVEADVPVAPKP